MCLCLFLLFLAMIRAFSDSDSRMSGISWVDIYYERMMTMSSSVSIVGFAVTCAGGRL